MERIKKIQIVGKEYLLNFSTRAAGAVMERYGGLDKINDAIFAKPANDNGASKEDNRSVVDIAKEAAWLLELLIKEGAAYSRVVEQKNLPALSADDLQIVLSAVELMDMRLPILEAIGAGLVPTVEVEQDTKNAEATQSS